MSKQIILKESDFKRDWGQKSSTYQLNGPKYRRLERARKKETANFFQVDVLQLAYQVEC